MTEKLKYLSVQVADSLYDSVGKNFSRYLGGDFLDLAEEIGWSIPLSLQVDTSMLRALESKDGVDSEIKNSLLVWKAMPEMTASLACENRIWTRLTHIECLDYSRKRWPFGTQPTDKSVESIRKHFFAQGRTQCRDDNAVSRLWWNAYIAKRMSPQAQEETLGIILKKADRRLNFIERPRMTSRPAVSSSVARLMLKERQWMDKEKNFREFMKYINKYGGGVLFEGMTENEVDKFMVDCLKKVQAG